MPTQPTSASLVTFKKGDALGFALRLVTSPIRMAMQDLPRAHPPTRAQVRAAQQDRDFLRRKIGSWNKAYEFEVAREKLRKELGKCQSPFLRAIDPVSALIYLTDL
ncbi:MAG TPA: hypothetical protein VG944_04965 [Fimbriimonas sp.]|nr:hypothetical protein [Fimbriimonas sp.]